MSILIRRERNQFKSLFFEIRKKELTNGKEIYMIYVSFKPI